VLNLDPTLYLQMVEQDRERAMAQRALERAARDGREPSPGPARAGINLFLGTLRRARSAIPHIQLGGSEPTSRSQGVTGA
jgi:hypothetical protein